MGYLDKMALSDVPPFLERQWERVLERSRSSWGTSPGAAAKRNSKSSKKQHKAAETAKSKTKAKPPQKTNKQQPAAQPHKKKHKQEPKTKQKRLGWCQQPPLPAPSVFDGWPTSEQPTSASPSLPPTIETAKAKLRELQSYLRVSLALLADHASAFWGNKARPSLAAALVEARRTPGLLREYLVWLYEAARPKILSAARTASDRTVLFGRWSEKTARELPARSAAFLESLKDLAERLLLAAGDLIAQAARATAAGAVGSWAAARSGGVRLWELSLDLSGATGRGASRVGELVFSVGLVVWGRAGLLAEAFSTLGVASGRGAVGLWAWVYSSAGSAWRTLRSTGVVVAARLRLLGKALSVVGAAGGRGAVGLWTAARSFAGAFGVTVAGWVVFVRQKFFRACAVVVAVEWRGLPWVWIAAGLAAAVALFRSGAWWGSSKVCVGGKLVFGL